MRYRHFAPFQAILQLAINSAALQKTKGEAESLTAPQYIRKLGLSKKLTQKRFSNFRNFDFKPEYFKQHLDGSYLTPADIVSPIQDRFTAVTLWDDLNKQGYINSALKRHPEILNKKTAFSPTEVASSLTSFYATHDSQIEDLDKKGFSTPKGQDWYCYKLSNRFPSYLIKSKMTLTTQRDHIAIYERQTALKGTEIMEIEEHEESTGYAISKAHKLWFFLREDEAEQPRIFCFHKLKERAFAETDSDTTMKKFGFAPRQMLLLLGHMMEMDRKYNNQFFTSPVALTLPAYERSLWAEKYGNRTYNTDVQCNLHPFDLPNNKPHEDFYMPAAVEAHLQHQIEIPL